MILLIVIIVPVHVFCSFEGYIVDGTLAKSEDWTFMGFLSFNSIRKRVSACGSTLISSRAVLTAAHCFPPDKFKNVTIHVLMGHVNFKKATMVRKVIDFTLHVGFDMFSDQLTGDIAICFLESHVVFSPAVTKVILQYEPIQVNGDEKVLSAGWGAEQKIRATKTPSVTLNTIDLTLVPTNICQRNVNQLEVGVMCTNRSERQGFLYHGDSGGPLVSLNKTQIGVVSYSSNEDLYTVYTSIYFYRNWIDETQTNLYLKYDCN